MGPLADTKTMPRRRHRAAPFIRSLAVLGGLTVLGGVTVLGGCKKSTSGETQTSKGGVAESAETSSKPTVQFETSMGTITAQLDGEKAPKTVANFIAYVKSGHYNGTIFHRVINNFMIQGGGFDENMNKKPTRAPIHNEADNGLKNLRYTLAMARTSDPHSASAQFFINVKDNGFLDFKSKDGSGWGYAVFGKVTQGTDIVDKIKAVQTGASGGRPNVPTTPVVIKSAKVIN